MGLLDIFRPKRKVVYTTDIAEFAQQFVDETYVPLNKHPDVLTAVDKIADLVSSMTIHLMENGELGDVRVRNGLAKKIDVNPCSYMTRKTFIYKIVRDLLLDGDGNSLVYIETDEADETTYIKNLIPIPMSSVEYLVDKDTYKIKVGETVYDRDELIHFVINPDTNNPYRGTGYKVSLKNIVKNLNEANKTKSSFMSNKHIPSLIVEVDANTDQFQSEKGLEEIRQKYLNSQRTGQPWIIPADMIKVEQIKPLTLKDIALNESVEIEKRTIAGLLGVPAFFLGVGKFDKDEYNNFIQTKIMSIAQTISQTLTRDLLFSSQMYFKMNPRSLYAYNLTDLVSAGGKMVELAAMRRNELRDWVGMSPDKEMEEIIVLENYLNQNDLGKQKKLKGDDELDA